MTPPYSKFSREEPDGFCSGGKENMARKKRGGRTEEERKKKRGKKEGKERRREEGRKGGDKLL